LDILKAKKSDQNAPLQKADLQSAHICPVFAHQKGSDANTDSGECNNIKQTGLFCHRILQQKGYGIPFRKFSTLNIQQVSQIDDNFS
jgi:hypothetical protein